ncbi:hypothetical protein OS493_006663 [Desmophyllum pertusum]|uniref:Uncharacterized protein n=1 Tax=Desmophyllum pertusum TaxID=174260 RepID=A0A9W9ZRL5_9CNID|nr:hypothetical protein OS493_006663 [Desmophyllum pertusum]
MAALVRFGSFVLVVLVLCNNVIPGESTAASPTSVPNGNITTVPTKPGNQSTAVPTTHGNHTTGPPTKPGNSTTVPTKPGNHSTAVPTKPGNHTTAVPTKPGNHSTAVPTTPGNYSTAVPTTHGNHKTPEGHNDGHASDRGKWVATGFAIFFVITTVVMTVLYCRQRKIYRELEGDSSLSRLI